MRTPVIASLVISEGGGWGLQGGGPGSGSGRLTLSGGCAGDSSQNHDAPKRGNILQTAGSEFESPEVGKNEERKYS